MCYRHHYNKTQRSIVGLEREKYKEAVRAIFPALKLCQILRSLRRAVSITYWVGESLRLCLNHRSLWLCLQPPGIPVFHCLWGRTVLQWPGLSALPPFLRYLCWYLLPPVLPFSLRALVWLLFCFVFNHHSCKPTWHF